MTFELVRTTSKGEYILRHWMTKDLSRKIQCIEMCFLIEGDHKKWVVAHRRGKRISWFDYSVLKTVPARKVDPVFRDILEMFLERRKYEIPDPRHKKRPTIRVYGGGVLEIPD